MKAEYTDPYLKVHAQAIEYADRDTTRIRQVAFVGKGERGSSIYCVSQSGGSVFVAVAGRCTVVFGDRGPVGFERTLGPHTHVEGKDECSGWFLRHMISSEKHECLYVQDLIDEAKERGDPAVSGEDAEPAWMKLHDDLLRNRYEITPDYYHTLVVGNGLEIDRFPSEPEYDAVFCAEVCVQIERWLYAKLMEKLKGETDES